MNTLSEREAFEAWAQKYPALEDDHGYVNLRYLGLHKQYVDFDVQRAWGSWQAALQWSAEASKQAEVQAAPPAPAAQGQWLPIESAPRDGTEVFVYVRGDSLFPTAAAYKSAAYFEKEYGDATYMSEGWYWAFGYPSDFHEHPIEPTHWMPLPQPPAIQAGTSERGKG